MFKKNIAYIGLLAVVSVVGFQNCSTDGFVASADLASLMGGASTEATQNFAHNDSHPSTEKVAEKATYEPLLADRYYLDSVFTSVFGPAARIVDRTTFANVQDNGAPCEAYSFYHVPKGTVTPFPMVACGSASADHTSAFVNPGATVTRQANLTRACSDLTFNTTTLRFALNQIEAGVAAPQVTDESLIKAFRLFYRIHPDPERSLIEALHLLVLNETPQIDDWRSILHTVCISSQWQVL